MTGTWLVRLKAGLYASALTVLCKSECLRQEKGEDRASVRGVKRAPLEGAGKTSEARLDPLCSAEMQSKLLWMKPSIVVWPSIGLILWMSASGPDPKSDSLADYMPRVADEWNTDPLSGILQQIEDRAPGVRTPN